MDTYVDRFIEQELNDRGHAKQAVAISDRIEVLSDEVTYTDYSEFLRRDNVSYLRELGLRHRAISFLNKDNLNSSQLTFQFGDNRGPITKDEVRNVETLLPHIAKALDLGRLVYQAKDAHRGILSAMDRLAIGVCVLDRFGHVTAQNNEFERQSECYGVFFANPSSKLCFRKPSDQLKFDELNANAQNNGKFGARPRKEAVATRTGEVLCIEVSPVQHLVELGFEPHGGAIVFSTDTSKPITVDLDSAAKYFGLSHAETKTAQLLSQGLTNNKIAQKLDRSSETIKFHIKAILSKTRCSNRTQFVRLLGNFRGDLIE
ncbi:helix-turn-helix domain-containing protein [Maritalea porphyrae]|uniref:helix-turn-helix domain-containing protein n=1 Tax=Maritalea porphyrae TaxID=880732 RepID=UPI0022AFFE27|nr:helix-turn-helix transcriptional regulator [Maritalea porphyrae]MCZ4274183.1 helix-turn-helix transcriptional regulator [Maritalea porphyrae]